jgi:TusA-related sulfurtransferase
MLKINCFGDVCPVPILKLQKQLKKTAVDDSFMMVIDHSCVIESLKDFISKTPHDVAIEEVLNGVWEIQITKRA